MIDSVLLALVRVRAFEQRRWLTGATGFLFQRDARLCLVTGRHVMVDAACGHHPGRLEIELHVDEANLARSIGFSIPLCSGGRATWRSGWDGGGDVDVAPVEIDRSALPAGTALRAFTADHLQRPSPDAGIGTSVLVPAFPLGFHDTLDHVPVVRHAIVASSCGLRLQAKGYFLTDARTARGTSGAPVVMRVAAGAGERPA